MTKQPRVRYQVRVRHAVAGSFLAAASAVSIAGISSSPAVASSSPLVLYPSSATPSAASSSPQISHPAPANAVRLAGVRSELDYAVALGSVSTEQADAFFAQIERRVKAGL